MRPKTDAFASGKTEHGNAAIVQFFGEMKQLASKVFEEIPSIIHADAVRLGLAKDLDIATPALPDFEPAPDGVEEHQRPAKPSEIPHQATYIGYMTSSNDFLRKILYKDQKEFKGEVPADREKCPFLCSFDQVHGSSSQDGPLHQLLHHATFLLHPLLSCVRQRIFVPALTHFPLARAPLPHRPLVVLYISLTFESSSCLWPAAADMVPRVRMQVGRQRQLQSRTSHYLALARQHSKGSMFESTVLCF